MAERITNAMTVDVEEHFHVSAFASVIRRSDWDGFDSRVCASTARLLRLFADARVRATFFVLGWVAERHPALIREIASAGHEVACHGYSHQLVYRQSPQEFRDETRRSKDLLEDITQQPVHGYRAASYSITSRSLWALDTLLDVGFTYDSSIFPVRHDKYGIPGFPPHPHRLRTPSGRELVEFPLSTAPVFGARMPVAGGGYFRLFPYRWTRRGLGRINAHERKPFIFYIHPWEVDPEQPRVRANPLSAFRHYNNLARCQRRLEQLLDEFRFGRVIDVLADLKLLGSLAPAGARS